MQKFTVSYTKIPTNYNDPRSLVVEAESKDAAQEIVRHHLRDLSGMSNYVYAVHDYVPPPAGKIVGAC